MRLATTAKSAIHYLARASPAQPPWVLIIGLDIAQMVERQLADGRAREAEWGVGQPGESFHAYGALDGQHYN